MSSAVTNTGRTREGSISISLAQSGSQALVLPLNFSPLLSFTATNPSLLVATPTSLVP